MLRLNLGKIYAKIVNSVYNIHIIHCIQKLEKACVINYRTVFDDSLPVYMVSNNTGTSSVLTLCANITF